MGLKYSKYGIDHGLVSRVKVVYEVHSKHNSKTVENIDQGLLESSRVRRAWNKNLITSFTGVHKSIE